MPIISHRFYLLTALLSLSSAALSVETIQTFDSIIIFQKDASLRVEERFTIRAEGHQIKHGIYRDFARMYKDHDGFFRQVKIEPLESLRNDDPEPYQIEQLKNVTRIHLGDKNRYLEPGIHTYTFRYLTNSQLNYSLIDDEIDWNIIDNLWAFPIENVNIHLQFSQNHNGIKPDLSLYSQSNDRFSPDHRIEPSSSDNAIYSLADGLAPGQSIKIVARWPKHTHTRSEHHTQNWIFLQNNPEIAVAIIGILLLAFYYVSLRIYLKRNCNSDYSHPGSDMASQHNSPAAIRFYTHLEYDIKTCTVALLSLATKGYLNIEEGRRGRFVLHKKNTATPLSNDEKTLLRRLFQEGTSFIALTSDNQMILNKALIVHEKALTSKIESMYFFSNKIIFGIAIGITLSTWSGMLLTYSIALTAHIVISTLILSSWTWLMSGILLKTVKIWRAYLSQKPQPSLQSLLLNTMACITSVGIEMTGMIFVATDISTGFAICLPLLIILNFVFYQELKAPHLAGQQVSAEIDRLKTFLSAEDTRATDYPRYLPYIDALDIKPQGSKKLETDEQRRTNIKQNQAPHWCNSRHLPNSNGYAFSKCISDALTRAIETACLKIKLRHSDTR